MCITVFDVPFIVVHVYVGGGMERGGVVVVVVGLTAGSDPVVRAPRPLAGLGTLSQWLITLLVGRAVRSLSLYSAILTS